MFDKKKSFKRLIINLPNILSISRLILVFPLIIFLELNKTDYVFIIIILGGLSDYLDGLIARRLNLKSRLGAVLDPLSDKVFYLVPLAFLSKYDLIPFWSLSIILFREFIISSLRKSTEDGLPATKFGKYKTFFFFISLILFFLPSKLEIFNNLGLFFYWLGFSLTISTFIDYLRSKKNFI